MWIYIDRDDIIGFFPTKDIQTTSLRNGHIYINDAQSADYFSDFYFLSYG